MEEKKSFLYPLLITNSPCCCPLPPFSGPGTSWDRDADRCALDPSSQGFNGTYSDDWEPGCVQRRCCGGDCCVEGTTFDEEIACCVPTGFPSNSPVTPTASSTGSPTASPTDPLTNSPTVKPTVKSTVAPTVKPTVAPTVKPTVSPTGLPTRSPTEPLAPPQERLTLSAVKDFKVVQGNGLVPAYVDTSKQALAINAKIYKDVFGAAETVYDGVDGSFAVVLTALTETDGESTYKLFVNDNEIGTAQNPPTDSDYVPAYHSFGNVTLKKGDTIQIRFNSASNGKTPEGTGFAYARGRWTTLTIG